ncbi:MAG: SpoIIE family protein phosphatase [Thermoleophilia bacterium]|nr:SpoIIE family protein phosphatase [Thermoleophilia bacterium]
MVALGQPGAPAPDAEGGRGSPLAALSASGRALAGGTTLVETLEGIARAAAQAASAPVAVVRELEGGSSLRARAVVTDSAALAAELEGTRLGRDEVDGETDEGGRLPAAVVAAAAKAGATAVLLVPAVAGGELVGTLELMRARDAFGDEERLLARLAADHAASAIRTFGPSAGNGSTPAAAEQALELAGEALVAAGDEAATETEIARVAYQAAGAAASLLWARDEHGLRFVASHGAAEAAAVEKTLPLAEAALGGSRSGGLATVAGAGTVATLPLGQPPTHVLQLLFAEGADPPQGVLGRLATFGARAAQALRAGARGRTLKVELERTRALLELVAEANEELSLAHTLATAVDRISQVLVVERIGVYLREGGRLTAAASRSLAGPHEPVAERLLELSLGPLRGRGILVVEDVSAEPELADLDLELAEAAVEAAVAVPLVLPDEVVGLLAVYPPPGRAFGKNERSLLAALAAQLAVSVQNARLHEEATRLGAELEDVLALERHAARQLGSLYEISRSFAQSLSLEATLEAVVTTVVALLHVDAAVIRLRDARGETLVPRALHIADERLAEALRSVISLPQPLEGLPRRRLRTGRAVTLDAETASRTSAHRALVPFLEKGSSAVVLPIATSTELLGTVELVSLDPARPITREATEIGISVAAQAALAIDNARLYQQHKEFADAMHRSLLPREEPDIPGIELGEVYASSARVELGGDVYDFIELEDGRLAVILGDVTGHGVDAAADMAMAKFVFRSLAREHSEPGAFLAAANDVVCGEIASGKFITMLYLTIEPGTGQVACASAGHPEPRVLLPDGTVRPLAAHGLALGIEPDQEYEEATAVLPLGAAVVLYTDGVVEVRRGGELFGLDRLEAVLSGRKELAAGDLAGAVLEECRAFGNGELLDDCALVVIKRTA